VARRPLRIASHRRQALTIARLTGSVSKALLFQNLALQVRPEFAQGVAREFAGKAVGRPSQRVARLGVAFNPPGVRQEIASRDCNVTRIGGFQLSCPVPGGEGHHEDVPETLLEARSSPTNV